MSLETKIEALTQAVVALTAQLQSSNVAPAAPVAPVAAPVVQAAPVVATPLAQAPLMPAAPVFTAPVTAAPVAAPAATAAPFTDGNGMMQYVMGAYKTLGPQKGAMIQGVLTGLGYQNINDVKPEHYGALFAGVEALK
jgi:hypothetical protein